MCSLARFWGASRRVYPLPQTTTSNHILTSPRTSSLSYAEMADIVQIDPAGDVVLACDQGEKQYVTLLVNVKLPSLIDELKAKVSSVFSNSCAG